MCQPLLTMKPTVIPCDPKIRYNQINFNTGARRMLSSGKAINSSIACWRIFPLPKSRNQSVFGVLVLVKK